MGAETELAALVAEATAALAAAATLQELREVRARFLGRKGSVSSRLRAIGALPQAERAAAGEALNRAAAAIEAAALEREAALERAGAETALRERALDVTLPGVAPARGALHPVTRVERDMAEFFAGLGFSVEEGPEVETEWHCFDALRIAADHPSRDAHDTFFVSGGHVLRTHTSPVQIRAMTGRTPPFRFIAPGRVFRVDFDATHSPFFHQIEGFMVDDRVTFGDMKGVLYAFARHLMGPDVELRFRAHFFPFTEPSAEFDFSWQGGWLEWGGCGMIHPGVLENCGIDATRWQGFAFGMTIDRTAMQRFGIPNIHRMFDGDVRALEPLA
ncbi:MAG TPA: phenylalanine--tRNA ligase subunit alpha [Myxococcota bacterium]|nr:phenylalanine--tRNA ligase subunit alpha [Myxococcota bacterium]